MNEMPRGEICHLETAELFITFARHPPDSRKHPPNIKSWFLLVVCSILSSQKFTVTFEIQRVNCKCAELSKQRARLNESVSLPEPHSGQRRSLWSVTVNQWTSWDSAGEPVHPIMRSVSYSSHAISKAAVRAKHNIEGQDEPKKKP
jgi:hypothetical protein